MIDRKTDGPQQTLLYRAVAMLSRFQLRYLLRRVQNSRLPVILFVFLAGATALSIITLAAYLTRLPLLFPPLGPSAFILFHTPMSERASPRNVILAHATALIAGMLSLGLASAVFPEADMMDPSIMNGSRVLAVAVAMGLISITMIVLHCTHPPAAATSLLVAMGFFQTPVQILGLLAAVILLVAEAFLLNRLIGGLPYPLWRANPRTLQHYGALAGLPEAGATYWERLSTQVLHQIRS